MHVIFFFFQARSPTDADLVRKAQSEGIRLPGAGDGLQKLPAQVVEEALILSELFNLNEISALQLLLKGRLFHEIHFCFFRGCYSHFSYYDSQVKSSFVTIPVLPAASLPCSFTTTPANPWSSHSGLSFKGGKA